MGYLPSPFEIRISIANQSLELIASLGNGETIARYSVSTALAGPSCLSESGGTPLGRHRVRLKIGHDAPLNAIFVGRRWTGEVYSPSLAERFPDRDFILSRILWLDGLEPGVNKGGRVDTLRRFVYIHGTNAVEQIGSPVSHGCIRMSSSDITSLFDMVVSGTFVTIVE